MSFKNAKIELHSFSALLAPLNNYTVTTYKPEVNSDTLFRLA